ncbi:hypothetical protein STEG23_030146 [Scotinomys teguina]
MRQRAAAGGGGGGVTEAARGGAVRPRSPGAALRRLPGARSLVSPAARRARPTGVPRSPAPASSPVFPPCGGLRERRAPQCGLLARARPRLSSSAARDPPDPPARPQPPAQDVGADAIAHGERAGHGEPSLPPRQLHFPTLLSFCVMGDSVNLKWDCVCNPGLELHSRAHGLPSGYTTEDSDSPLFYNLPVVQQQGVGPSGPILYPYLTVDKASLV